jgi:hypothetical protein
MPGHLDKRAEAAGTARQKRVFNPPHGATHGFAVGELNAPEAPKYLAAMGVAATISKYATSFVLLHRTGINRKILPGSLPVQRARGRIPIHRILCLGVTA